jgi:acetyltransferase
MTVRPIRPDDESLYARVFAATSPEDIRLRFFAGRRSFRHAFIAHLTQIDYAREMAFVAISNERNELLGVSRLVLDPDLTHGEFGILVRSDMQGRGIGRHLMDVLLRYARHEGVQEIKGIVDAENKAMLDMAQQLGFSSKRVEGDPALREVVWRVADMANIRAEHATLGAGPSAV